MIEADRTPSRITAGAGPPARPASGPGSAADGGRRLAAAYALSGLGGAPALVYQIAWRRILALHGGVGFDSVAPIVVASMSGLALGSLAGAGLARRLGPRGALRAFAVSELMIGLFASAGPWLYYDLLYARGAYLDHAPWRAGVLHFLALLPPTFAMGLTLPLLVRAMVRDARSASRTIGLLYAVNALGAAAGALATPWVLIRFLGIPGAILAGACGNAVVGLGALALGRSANVAPDDDAEPDGPAVVPRGPFGLWLVLQASGGFVAIALAILWFRLVDVGTKATAFGFGTFLAVYLSGLGIGSALGARRAARWRDPLATFLACQCVLLLYAGGAVALLAYLPTGLPGLRSFFAFCGQYEGNDLVPQDLARGAMLYGGFPLLLFGIPTALMGYSFAAMQAAVHDRGRLSGTRVGLLQAANIAGGVAGSLVVGLLLLSTWGTAGTLRALVASGVVFAAGGCAMSGSRARFAAAGLGLLALASILPGQDRLWRRLHGQGDGPAFLAEDATGVAALTPEADGRWRVTANGRGQGWLPFGPIHGDLGALPATLHPSPKRIAIIGLGSGDTAWAAACRRRTDRVTVFETCAPLLGLLHALDESVPIPTLASFLRDERIEVVAADGRDAITSGDQTYDLIEAAFRPTGASSGKLDSVEFFRLCGAKLNRGGLMCTWSPTRRIRASFREAFPHVLEIEWGLLLIGSNDPIRHDPVVWLGRLHTREVADYLGQEIIADVSARITTGRIMRQEPSPAPPVNHDLYPADEYPSP